MAAKPCRICIAISWADAAFPGRPAEAARFPDDYFSARQIGRGAAHPGDGGSQRRGLRGADSAVVVRQAARARPAGKIVDAPGGAGGCASALRLYDRGGAGTVPAAHQHGQRHRAENRAQHSQRHQCHRLSRRGGGRRCQNALANFRGWEKNGGADRGGIEGQDRRGRGAGGGQRAAGAFRRRTKNQRRRLWR